ncbi:dehalogenase [Dehalococcoides mccartyi]|jgi:hypothetical protein|uniref:Reductive dehalogenase anchoring protein n=1 Tax=Dehalococcoides mccartyi (strain VS) TaxID=311424 RepID=D2BJH3_DEHMV|nr:MULTISPECIES: hypothetical protein [Dehalococcoides]ACZ62473.1 reductive dehalogenase anchoring protein [Dehalococcoides mccartyi VS]AII58505.1 dehalogenase [Dehalococcoides mccartyi CG1]APH13117.1 dehalogenase [Dehalococcoides mccartyi]BAQ35328.1 putative reductive dehalogenase membrane anchoring protein [Dehalococcoides sp. UCH007]
MEYFVPLMLVGAVIAAALFGITSWLRNRNLKVSWYEWLIGGIGFALLLLAVQHFFGALEELFPFAALMGLAIIGIPALILMVIAWQLVARRAKQA